MWLGFENHNVCKEIFPHNLSNSKSSASELLVKKCFLDNDNISNQEKFIHEISEHQSQTHGYYMHSNICIKYSTKGYPFYILFF